MAVTIYSYIVFILYKPCSGVGVGGGSVVTGEGGVPLSGPVHGYKLNTHNFSSFT